MLTRFFKGAQLIRKPSRATVGWIVGLTALAKLALHGDVQAATAPTARRTLAFCESLEPVIEAVTDGRPAKVPAAAHEAQAWWRAHDADTVYAAPIAAMIQHADSHRAPLAAAAAVRIAELALSRCTEPQDLSVAVMRLDVAGMSAWLRSKGFDSVSPVGSVEASRLVGARLRALGQGTLADKLESEVAAAVAIPKRVNGATGAANQLLQTVDVVEEALKKK